MGHFSLKIPLDIHSYIFTNLSFKIKDLTTVMGVAHCSCRVNLKRKFFFQKKIWQCRKTLKDSSVSCEKETSYVKPKRRWFSTYVKEKSTCYICNEIRKSDDNPYNQWGLASCCEEASSETILKRIKEYLGSTNHRWYTTVTQSHDFGWRNT